MKVHPSAGASASAPGVRSAAPDPATEVFANVFESARQSARADQQWVHARRVGGRASAVKPPQKRPMEKAAKPHAEPAEQPPSQRTDKPSRAGTLREQADQQPASKAASEQASKTTPNEQEQQAQDTGAQHAQAAAGEPGPIAGASPESAASQAVLDQAQPSAAGCASTVAEPVSGGNATAQPVSLALAGSVVPAGVTAAAQGEGGEAPIRNGQTPEPAAVQAKVAAGVSISPAKPQPGGDAGDAQQKSTEPGGTSAGPRPQFQNILDTHAAQRGQMSGRVQTAVNGNATSATTVNMNESRSVGELAGVVRSAIGTGRSTMMLRLDPPELGQVQVDVRMEHGVLNLKFEAATPAGQEALQGKLNDLRGALEQHGIQVSGMQVELRPPAAPQHQAGEQSTPQQQGWTAGHAFGGSQGQQFDGREQGTWGQNEPAAGLPLAGAVDEVGGPVTRGLGPAIRQLDLVA